MVGRAAEETGTTVAGRASAREVGSAVAVAGATRAREPRMAPTKEALAQERRVDVRRGAGMRSFMVVNPDGNAGSVSSRIKSYADPRAWPHGMTFGRPWGTVRVVKTGTGAPERGSAPIPARPTFHYGRSFPGPSACHPRSGRPPQGTARWMLRGTQGRAPGKGFPDI